MGKKGRVLTCSIECPHMARHASSGGGNRGHVTAIGHVRAAALLVCMQEISADSVAVFSRRRCAASTR